MSGATPAMLAALERARIARAENAKKRGCYLTPEGLERQREHGRRNKAAWSASRAFKASQEKPIGDDADTMIWQVFQLIAASGKTHREICKAASISERALREWRLGASIPSLDSFRRVAWALGYVVTLEKFEQRPRDKSIWLAPRAPFDSGTIR